MTPAKAATAEISMMPAPLVEGDEGAGEGLGDPLGPETGAGAGDEA